MCKCLEIFEIPLNKVMAIKMDNVSSNDTFITNLNKIIPSFTSTENRVRCILHIVNLAVQDILKSLKINLRQEPYEVECWNM